MQLQWSAQQDAIVTIFKARTFLFFCSQHICYLTTPAVAYMS